MKKIAVLLVPLMLIASVLTGCQTSGSGGTDTENETASADAAKTKELQQNDYRGGVMRTLCIKDSVLKTLDEMKANNITIRQDSPNSFWTADGYQDFVSTFLDTSIIDDTCYFNEEETSWEVVCNQMASVPSSFTMVNTDSETGYSLKTGVVITRNEKDDYAVSEVEGAVSCDSANSMVYKGIQNYRILYDCDKDWCKAYAEMTIDATLPKATAQLYEYMRVDDNTFVVQTSRERMIVILAPAEKDTDLREREVREFYYSKLVRDGMRTTFEPYEPLPEMDEAYELEMSDNKRRNEFMATYPCFNERGDISVYYGQNDSVFYRSPTEITPDNFVFEDKSLQQAICYKDGVLVATTYNKLSGNYERFVYAKKDAKDSASKELEAMVEIKNLVGIQEVEEQTTEPVTTTATTTTTTVTTVQTDENGNPVETEAESETTAEGTEEGATE